MTERLLITRIVSMELDGVPPQRVSIECEGSLGQRVALAMDAGLAAQLEAALLRIPLRQRQGRRRVHLSVATL